MTATSRRIESRRERNQQIAVNDALKRCTFCRRELPKLGVVILLTPSGNALRYCNETCHQDHRDKLFTLEARR